MPEESRAHRIPAIEVAPLFKGAGRERDGVDAAIFAAATTAGFFVARGLRGEVAVEPEARASLLDIFKLPEAEKRKLWRAKFLPQNANVYRGWFPTQSGQPTFKEGIDIGPDLLYGPSLVRSDDPLRERTPLPPESVLPGWRDGATRFYASVQRISGALLQSIARSLKLPESFFDAAFDGGISTLRLLRYPVRPDARESESAGIQVRYRGESRFLVGAPHVDSGFLTLLAQDGAEGLQVEHLGGEWVDVPPEEGTLVVNFGKILERWSHARIKATPHRVLGSHRERRSIAFFYESQAEAIIAPLPMDPKDAFEPFVYGDFLWEAMTKFVEFQGVARRANRAHESS